ncbi:MAG TPA: phosphoribosyltransferase [Firmicutes bacterium]|nr:phosphoribosyltransferase [Bacillota bacterium]
MFLDRQHAGVELGKKVLEWLRSHGQDGGEAVVFGIPRGGVVVAGEVAKVLRCPLRLVIARKIGAPFNPELAIGAVGPDGTITVDEKLTTWAQVPSEELFALAKGVLQEISRRAKVYGQKEGIPEAARKTVVLVDDGVATGITVRAAIESLKRAGASKIVLAVPVAPKDVLEALARWVDGVICLSTPEDFVCVGNWYVDFHQVSDEEVINILRAGKTIGDEGLQAGGWEWRKE